jgi:hypothetical protein
MKPMTHLYSIDMIQHAMKIVPEFLIRAHIVLEVHDGKPVFMADGGYTYTETSIPVTYYLTYADALIGVAEAQKRWAKVNGFLPWVKVK